MAGDLWCRDTVSGKGIGDAVTGVGGAKIMMHGQEGGGETGEGDDGAEDGGGKREGGSDNGEGQGSGRRGRVRRSERATEAGGDERRQGLQERGSRSGGRGGWGGHNGEGGTVRKRTVRVGRRQTSGGWGGKGADRLERGGYLDPRCAEFRHEVAECLCSRDRPPVEGAAPACSRRGCVQRDVLPPSFPGGRESPAPRSFLGPPLRRQPFHQACGWGD